MPWQQIAKRTGAEFRVIGIDDSGELRLDGLDAIASAGRVKVVAANLVSNTLGTINPIERLTAWAHEQGAIMVVDAAQAVAAPARRRPGARLRLPRASRRTRCCGPTGAGALYGRRELLERDVAVRDGRRDDPQGLDRGDDLERAAVQVRGRARPPIVEAFGMGAAIDYITEVGLEAIEEHEHELAVYAIERLAELDWVTVYGPPAEPARRDRLVQRRGRPPARRRADPRLGGRRGPRRPPLHASR